jgi:glycosidase
VVHFEVTGDKESFKGERTSTLIRQPSLIMVTSLFEPAVQRVLDKARENNGTLFPSPEDWRDVPIYFLMLDRFNNPDAPPRNLPFDASFDQFQGGSYKGVREKLQYIKDLGFGGIWLSPVLKNRRTDIHAYHGYGIQHFLIAEPRFASNPEKADQELRELVDAAHELGLYIIFDIVLHHAGDVFEYVPGGGDAPFQNHVIPIRWRDENGNGNPAFSEAPPNPPLDAAVFPSELRHNALFVRQGNAFTNGFHPEADFNSLKAISFAPPRDGLRSASEVLIRAYQYVIARFDVDAFRIDTLKFIPPDFERTFANAMREFALSAGKKNFFTFGEVFDNEQTIAQFIGRNTNATGDVVGVDAALDYPLFFELANVVKGLGNQSPADLAAVFENRKRIEESILTSHGEAGEFFVTFLDNHDQGQRFGFTGDNQPQLVNQIKLGLAVLFCLQGIPCVYYGTEQALSGHKDQNHTDDSMVREALWGKPGGGFDTSHPLYVAIQNILKVRASQPALRYGRQYFRQVSGEEGVTFGLSPFSPGVLAFSRILNDQEVVLVANINFNQPFKGEVIIDRQLHPAGATVKALFSNKRDVTGLTTTVLDKTGGRVTIHEINGSITNGPARTVRVDLQQGEVQILA